MKAAVILAAGRSSRSGRQHKAGRHLRHRGKRISWLDYQIDRLRDAGFQRIRLVLGSAPKRVLRHLHRRVEVRHNRQSRLGTFSSLQCALRTVHSNALVVPLDNPVPDRAALYKLKRALNNHLAAQPRYRGRGGHPVLLSKTLITHLSTLDPSSAQARLDEQLRVRRHAIARVDNRDPRTAMNLNRANDWHAFRRRCHNTLPPLAEQPRAS